MYYSHSSLSPCRLSAQSSYQQYSYTLFPAPGQIHFDTHMTKQSLPHMSQIYEPNAGFLSWKG